MSEYIRYIKKTIDVEGTPTVTDIYLHDSRVSDSISSTDVNKALLVDADGNIAPVMLHYLPVDATTGALTANLSAGSFKIVDLATGTSNNDAVNVAQLTGAISDLGNVMNYVGSVLTYSNLPATGNEIGDVYYVQNDETIESVKYPGHCGYAWIQVGNGTPWWEQLGPVADLSSCLKIADLAASTGQSTVTAMTQKAASDAISAVSDVANAAIPAPESPSDNDILTYDATEGKWVAGSAGSVGVMSITAKDNSIVVDTSSPYSSANPAVGVKISAKTGNTLEVVTTSGEEGLYTAGEEQVQANWTETDTTSKAYIQNKPTLGSAAAKDALNGNIVDYPSADDLVDSSQVVTYVQENNIYTSDTEPSVTGIKFWFDTSTSLLKHRVIDTEPPYAFSWEIVGGKVTGVKGNAESTYRTGNVNLTPANLGAIADPDTKSANQYLGYNGSAWVAQTIALGTVDESDEVLIMRTGAATVDESDELLSIF